MADAPPDKTLLASAELYRYARAHAVAPDDVQRDLQARTAALGPVSGMQIAHDQAVLMTLLTRLVGARVAVEVGTFTGYSSLAIARGLAPGGRLICCDVSEEWTAIARQSWEAAGVADRIDLRIGPAAETLAALDPELQIDLAFVDADKTGYAGYHEQIVPRLRPGGLLLVDNVLWSGRVVEADAEDADTVAIREYNARAVADPRLEGVIVPIADGLFVLRKR